MKKYVGNNIRGKYEGIKEYMLLYTWAVGLETISGLPVGGIGVR